MRTSNTLKRRWHFAMFVMLMTAAVSCVGILEDEQNSANGGGSSGTGGSNEGGASASAIGISSTAGSHAGGTTGGASAAAGSHAGGTTGGATATGGSHAGGVTGGASAAAGSHAGGSSAGASATGGSSTSGNSTGGSSTGGTGGCIDVCALYGPPCCVWSNACLEPGGSCVIDVLSGNGTTSGSYADLEQKIASLPPDALVSIRDVDIASAAADPPLAARIEMHLTSEASSLYGTVLDNVRNGEAFRFSCGGQVLFVGVYYDVNGAAAFNLPALYATRDADNLVVLLLSAWEGAWYGSWNVWGDEPGVRERFDRLEFRAVMCQRGALSELGAGVWPVN